MPDAPKTLLVLGATSDIGRAVARAFARRGWTARLAGRDVAALDREAADVATRAGGTVSTHAFDALRPDTFAGFLDGLPELPDAAVCVVGMLGEQRQAETELDHATQVLRANFEGPALILGMLAERFARRGSGAIVGFSSVAGDRGRASNYVYGSAKAGLTAFLSGLRNRLSRSGVAVLTVKPGFVRTKMIAHLKTPAALTAEPDEVAEAVWTGVAAGRDVVYVKPVWRVVMLVIRSMPEALFKRLKL